MTDPFKLASWLYFRWRRLEVEVHDVGAHRAEDLEGSLREAACLHCVLKCVEPCFMVFADDRSCRKKRDETTSGIGGRS